MSAEYIAEYDEHCVFCNGPVSSDGFCLDEECSNS